MVSQSFYARKRIPRPERNEALTYAQENFIIDDSKVPSKWKNSKIRYAAGAFSLGLAMLACSWISNSLFIDSMASGEGSERRNSGFPRFVTVVTPSEVDSAHCHRRLNSIHETWGPAAPAIFVVRNVTDYEEIAKNGIISEITHSQSDLLNDYPKLLLVPEDVEPDRTTPYVRYITKIVFELLNPDFALFVNDHTFVIPEHVISFLEEKRSSHDIYAGHALGKKESFHPNSAGTLMSRCTMQRLVQKLNEKDPVCTSQESNAGYAISRCLNNVLNITTAATRRDNRYQRFHAFPLTRLVSGEVDEWYDNISTEPNLYGKDCCANDTVTFHYVEYLESRALFATRNALKENPQMTDEELKALMVQVWPTKDIGAYSRGLPKSEDIGTWETLLYVVRKITVPPKSG